MNTEKTLKNSMVSVIAQIITMLFQFVNRRVFIEFLDIEYLGYQTLFGNIFSLLSVAELGIGNIISFHLYKEIVEKNEEEIGKLMYLYKWLYRIVAIVVLVAGLGCYFLLPYFVRDAQASWSYLYLIYFLQLTSVIAGYFLSYKRTIYIATQQEYKCVQIDLYTTMIIQTVQLILLAILKSYIIYLCLHLSTTMIANIIISRKTSKDYPFLNKKYTLAREDIKKRNIVKDIINFLVHKISYAIYGGTDNIIISSFCGIRNVALYGNYVTVSSSVMNVLFYRLLNPVQATIGNIIYGNRNKDKLWEQFKVFDVFSFFFASFIGLGFFIFFQPFIQLWMGKDYLLPYSFVILFSMTIYFQAVWEIVYKYRTVFGDYKQDRNFMIVSAVLNLIISIFGAKFFGISGVQFGTLIAYTPIALGRIRFVIKNYFGQSMIKYILRHFSLFFIVISEGIISYILTKEMPINISGFLGRIVVWIGVVLSINTILFYKNVYFREMIRYLRKAGSIITKKIKKNKINL